MKSLWLLLVGLLTAGCAGDGVLAPDRQEQTPLVTLLDRDPIPIEPIRAAYPCPLIDAGISGDVLVEYEVGEDGRVTFARVVESSHPRLDEPAMAAVTALQFEPALRDGHPVKATLRQPIHFELPEPEITGIRGIF